MNDIFPKFLSLSSSLNLKNSFINSLLGFLYLNLFLFNQVMEMRDEKDAFYVVRKGDIIGIYKTITDCQAQAAFSPLDPSMSVFKGYGLSKEAESYLVSHGLKQAGFSISASSVQDGLFGALSVCPFQDTVGSSTSGNPENKPVKMKNDIEPQAPVYSGYGTVGSSSTRNSQNEHLNLKNYVKPQLPAVAAHVSDESSLTIPMYQFRKMTDAETQQLNRSLCKSCTVEFDGASKGNPGLAGAGAILRADDGSKGWQVREGVGIATNNVAEYRSVILGLRTALQKGYKHIRVRGDSQLVIYQIQGRWRTKNENMAILCKQAKELVDKFESFAIEHVAREFNSDADAQANRAINLRDGHVEIDAVIF